MKHLTKPRRAIHFMVLALLMTLALVATLPTKAKADSHAVAGSSNFQIQAFNHRFAFKLPDNLCQVTEGDWYNTTMEFLKTAEVHNKTIGLALECW